MGKREDNLMKFAGDAVVVGSTATGYTVGANEGLRRTGLGFVWRGLISGGVGVLGGLALAKFAPRAATGLFTGGLVSGVVNGIAGINTARFRGKVDSSTTRGALPGGATTTTTTTTPPAGTTQGLPAQQRPPQPQRMGQPVGAVRGQGGQAQWPTRRTGF